MPTMLDSLCALLLVLAAAAPAAAQSAAAAGATAGRPTGPDIAQAAPTESAATEQVLGAGSWREGVGLDRVDGVLVGAGPGYKAEFDAAGIHYTMALGFAAPQAGTLSFELDSIRRGDQPLATGTPNAAPVHAGMVVTYERGPSIREQYIVQPDGLEQQFVFDSLPAGAGDLVVRGRVTTSLVARGLDGSPGVGVFRDGLRFESPGYGSFVYGGVTGVDARGKTVAGELRFDGEWLELSLPEHFVSTAALPLTLDPLLGDNKVVGDTPTVRDPDIAYDLTHDVYLVVWEVGYGTPHTDIYGQRVSPGGALVGNLVLIEPFTILEGTEPCVANNNGSDRFLVAWEQFPAALGVANDLFCTLVNASNGALSNRYQFGIGGQHPVAGGESLPGYPGVQVVWDSNGIRGRTLLVPPTGDPSGAASYVLTVAPYHYGVAISRSGGDPGRYLVSWYGFDPVGGSSDVFARSVTYQGVVDSPIANLTQNFEIQDAHPAVDGDGFDFVVAYERWDNVAQQNDIACKRVHWDSGALSWNAAELYVRQGAKGVSAPVICLLGGEAVPGKALKYAVAWHEEDSHGLISVRYREIDPVTCTSCGLLVWLNADVDKQNYWVAMASEVNGGSAGVHDGGLATFIQSDFFGNLGLHAQAFEALGAGGTVVDMGGGCAGGGTASTFGPLAIGNKAFEYRLTGAAPSATVAIHNMSFAPTYFPCGSCVGIVPGILHVRPLVGGNASFLSPVPCNASALGIVYDSDWIVLPVPTVPCPAFPNFAISNVLRLTVGE